MYFLHPLTLLSFLSLSLSTLALPAPQILYRITAASITATQAWNTPDVEPAFKSLTKNFNFTFHGMKEGNNDMPC
ncbi:MAG: hypothetical protein Q9226_004855, partial [Calogaya cf. arnoldii]